MKKSIIFPDCPLRGFREKYRLTEAQLSRLAQLRPVDIRRAHQAVLLIERGGYSANLFELIKPAFQKLGFDPGQMQAQIESWMGLDGAYG
jgi:hypothetical protein